MSDILAIIPARIGSKGVKEKNLLKIGKYTLVERALFTAMGSKIIKNITVSSDSNRIINIVNGYGNYAPYKRPSNLSTDIATSLEVIKHALDFNETYYKKKFNYIALLEPPSPFRLPSDLDYCIKLAKGKKASSVVSVIKVGDSHPIRMKKMNKNGLLSSYHIEEPDGFRRQDQDDVFIRNGSIYIFESKTIKDNKLWGSNSYGYEMNRNYYGINIDEQNDVLLAKSFYTIMKNNNKLDFIEYIPK